ncbi:pirin family protein [Fulvivirga sediminis]|uniref:Pirin family protein n=1 Tax=Fulvivirga sediminis TaxID=2803949 RepID=A0A937FBE2_9BACT|nr:pirin family protein [Fulvivirga sediminis]MBL3658079.1 pirin family protein [Fulvivirga sediminis]
MKKIIHRANTRGHANHGWLDTHHTFSFASYYDPSRMNFGMLRVLNDDVVSGGAGFGKHPHDNMEIISIPLSGSLKHEDSMGNSGVIETNEVQIMSAGTGIVHSEFNPNENEKVNFLQIWVFPKQHNIEPRYGQKAFNPEDRLNKIQTVVSPEQGGDALWINQDAYFSLANMEEGLELTYDLKSPQHGVYIFNLSGEVAVGDEVLAKRDGMGIYEVDQFTLQAKEKSDVILIEVPMTSRG